MFLTQERPGTDDFVKKISGSEGKILCRNFTISCITKKNTSFSRNPNTNFEKHFFAYSCV